MRMRRWIQVLVIVFLIPLLMFSAAGQAFAKKGKMELYPWVKIQGVMPLIENAQLLGDYPDKHKLKFTLFLRSPQKEKLQSMRKATAGLQGLASYRKHLDGDQVREQFGLKDEELHLLLDHMAEYSLTIESISGNRLRLIISGTTEDIERAFATDIKAYEKDGIKFYAPAKELKMPRQLKKYVTHVSGLDNYPRQKKLASQSSVYNADSSPELSTSMAYFASTTAPAIQATAVKLTDHPEGKITALKNEELTLTLQLVDDGGYPVAQADQDVECYFYYKGTYSPSSNVKVLNQNARYDNSKYMLKSDEEGKVSLRVSDGVSEGLDLYLKVAGTTASPVYAKRILFCEGLTSPETLNSSLNPQNSIPTGQNLVVNLRGLPANSKLQVIQDAQGEYLFRGISSVETKFQSTSPDAFGKAQLWLRVCKPVTDDEFNIIYSLGSGYTEKFYRATFKASWHGPSVIESGLSPQQVNVAYNARELVAKEIEQPGSRIAILASAEWSASDLETYFRASSLPLPQVIPIKVNVSSSLARSGPLFEELMLDIERAGSSAPGAKIYIYQQPWENPLLEVVAQAIEDNLVSVISSSIGMFESGMTPEEIESWQDQMALADLQGITVIFASGDSGAYGNWSNRAASPDVIFPGMEDVTLVGGTQLGVDAVNYAWSSEEAWSPDRAIDNYYFTAGGGGFSQKFARPDWQRFPEIYGNMGRGVPDISFLGDNEPGYKTFMYGKWLISSGTSAAAPTWAGYVAALAHQKERRFGNMNPMLYQLSSSFAGDKIFNRIMIGNNGLYSIREGDSWNPVTGLGSINIEALRSAIPHNDNLSQSEMRVVMKHKEDSQLPGLSIGLHNVFSIDGLVLEPSQISGVQFKLFYNPNQVVLGNISDEVGFSDFTWKVAQESTTCSSLTIFATQPMGGFDRGELFHIPLYLVSKGNEPVEVSACFTDIAGIGQTVSLPVTKILHFQRGKILNDVQEEQTTVKDAVAGLHHLVGLKNAGFNEGEVNLINSFSILGAELIPNGNFQIGHVIALLQYLVGLRDEYFRLKIVS